MGIWQDRDAPFQKMEASMDRLEGMSIVLAVAEAGSLSAAARRHRMPLATVSRKVSELEAHLRTKLFNRSSRVLVPTDTGLSYIAAAKRILADVAEAERAASGEYATPRGELSVSAPMALGRLHLMPVLAEFVATFLEVDIDLDLRDRAVNLLEEHVDVALRIGTLADSSLIAIRIGEIQARLHQFRAAAVTNHVDVQE
jgi:DNA-binding transcriptional LysR family regulator